MAKQCTLFDIMLLSLIQALDIFFSNFYLLKKAKRKGFETRVFPMQSLSPKGKVTIQDLNPHRKAKKDCGDNESSCRCLLYNAKTQQLDWVFLTEPRCSFSYPCGVKIHGNE